MEGVPRGTVELALAAAVLFSAMVDPKISVAVAVGGFIGLSIFRWRAAEGTWPDAEVNALRNGEPDGNMAKILFIAKEQGTITIEEIAETLQIREDEAKQSLQALESQGALEQVGYSADSPLYRLK